MRRSVCLSEPKIARAGQRGTWKFAYIPSSNLPAKTLVCFDFHVLGREIDWELPNVASKKKENLIWMDLPDGSSLAPKAIDNEQGVACRFEFRLPQEIAAGEEIAIFVGTPEESLLATHGNMCQKYIQRRRPFFLYIDTKGKGDYKDPEQFFIDVKGNKMSNIQVVVPSVVAKNQRFDILVRFEDAFGNLTGFCSTNTMIELSYEQLRDNLNWKLFVPETGFIALPNLYFNEPGVYKLRLENLSTKEVFFSPPIKCFQELDASLYWGLLHGESERFDTLENVESALRTFRDDSALNFYATSPFDAPEEVSNEEWKHINLQISDFNEPERFSTFLGFQYFGEEEVEGLHQVLFSKDSKQIMRKKDTKTGGLKKLCKTYTSKEMMLIPSFTMSKQAPFNFEEVNPEYVRVAEIYNSWGSSECLSSEDNLRPISVNGKPSEYDKGSLRDALDRNIRFGFVAGGLDDRGIYSSFFESKQTQYTPGMTAIFAAELSKDSLFQALYMRRTYATTGPKMVSVFQLASMPMGSELNTKSKPGLSYNRHLSGFFAGTTDLVSIDIIRCGEVWKTIQPKGFFHELSLDDSEPLKSIALSSSDGRPDFVYYYVRVIQKDGHIAWSSPIWIDLVEDEAEPVLKKGKKKA